MFKLLALAFVFFAAWLVIRNLLSPPGPGQRPAKSRKRNRILDDRDVSDGDFKDVS